MLPLWVDLLLPKQKQHGEIIKPRVLFYRGKMKKTNKRKSASSDALTLLFGALTLSRKEV